MRGKKAISDESIRREKAVQLKCQRAGHLGDVRRKLRQVQKLIQDNSRELREYN